MTQKRLSSVQKQTSEVSYEKIVQRNFMKFAGNFIKKEALAQVSSCKFCQISKNTFFTEHPWKTASVDF